MLATLSLMFPFLNLFQNEVLNGTAALTLRWWLYA